MESSGYKLSIDWPLEDEFLKAPSGQLIKTRDAFKYKFKMQSVFRETQKSIPLNNCSLQIAVDQNLDTGTSRKLKCNKI